MPKKKSSGKRFSETDNWNLLGVVATQLSVLDQVTDKKKFYNAFSKPGFLVVDRGKIRSPEHGLEVLLECIDESVRLQAMEFLKTGALPTGAESSTLVEVPLPGGFKAKEVEQGKKHELSESSSDDVTLIQ